MRMSRLMFGALTMILAVGVSIGTARADGTDPQGKFQAPSIGGTPGVDNEFSLPNFGSTGPGCTFDGSTEDCVLKNQSLTNWTWVQITIGADVPCSSVTFTTDLFSNAPACTNTSDSTTILLSGVNYSPENSVLFSTVSSATGACVPPGNPSCNITNIQTALVENPAFSGNCNPDPTNGYFPGVLIGCDFEVAFGPGPDGGNWPLGAPINVLAPEPGSMALLMTGLLGLPFVRRRKLSA